MRVLELDGEAALAHLDKNLAISCNSQQYENHGRCCSLCRPGQRLNKECAESSDTECLKCDDGYYQNTWNRETSCLPHSDCNEELGFEKISEGNIENNVDCECQKGRHCSSEACETCVQNTACGPGQGVFRSANRSLDTICAPCPEGTFSNVTSDTEPCIKWQMNDVPEKIEQPLVEDHQPQNVPEEDQDITMQGLPVAQEQGKDCHFSQEEV
ncbi:tumor necrosis factor receptor superfamily member 5 [Gastrophryne carolinensis]